MDEGWAESNTSLRSGYSERIVFGGISNFRVMPGLVRASTNFKSEERTWMSGTSPAMTT
jgi:hypothetical protein